MRRAREAWSATSRIRRSALGTLLLTAAGCILLTGAPSAGDDTFDTARTTLEKWVEIRRLISKEKQDWTLGREVLDDRIDLVKTEIEAYRGKIEAAREEIEKTTSEWDARDEELDGLRKALASLEVGVAPMEARTKQLLSRLPEPISDRVDLLSRRLPDVPTETKLRVTERFQNVVGILNEVNKFNREITVTSEVRSLPDGGSVEVAVMYLGIGKAYYVSINGDVAGVGTVSPDGWSWKPANEAADEIATAIGILRNEQQAEFVGLPIEIE